VVVQMSRQVDPAGARTDGLGRLEAGTPVPLYHRIKEDLSLQIRSGSWRPGLEIPSEAELCRHYGVSRGTIRRAVADLVQQGLVCRRQGSGSFVSQPKLEGSVLGSYRQYRKEGAPFDVEARVLRCVRRPAPPEIRRILGIAGDEAVYEVERVRFVQGRPVSLQVSYLPARLCPGLEQRDLAGSHFYDVLQREYGTVFLRAEEFVEPVLADDYVAQQLRVAVGSPLFLVERHSYTFGDRGGDDRGDDRGGDGRVGEFRRGHVRGDLYRYRIDLR
jgi:GntR family transcriptional regulator